MRRGIVAPGIRPAGFVAFAKIALFALSALGVCVPNASAQGTRKDDIVMNARGTPQAGANVAICTATANTTTAPCSPLANIYKDPALTQALANPITTDGLGNYFFYAAPGKYKIQIYGPGITTKVIPDVTLPLDSAGVTNVSGAITAFSLSLSGNLTVNGSAAVTLGLTAPIVTMANQSTPPGTPSTGNVVVYSKTDKNLYFKDDTGTEKPMAGSGGGWPPTGAGIRFADPGGSSSNDGLDPTVAHAMPSIEEACFKLPGGNAATRTCGTGAIYFTNGTKVSAQNSGNCFFGLMGDEDPNFANPPQCWDKATNHQAPEIIGWGAGAAYGPNAERRQVGVHSSGQFAFAFSRIFNTTYLENVGLIDYPTKRALQIGICSDGTNNPNNCNVSSIKVLNFGGHLQQSSNPTGGPCIFIGGAPFFQSYDDIGCTGNVSATGGATSDGYQAIVIDGTSASASVAMNNVHLSVGGLRVKQSTTPGTVIITNVTQEGDFADTTPATVDLIGNASLTTVTGVATADSLGSAPAVNIQTGFCAQQILNVSTDNGRAAINGCANSTGQAANVAQYQSGFTATVLGAMPDVLARSLSSAWNFPPVQVLYGNFAATQTSPLGSSGAWGSCTSCTFSAVADPAGGTSAVRLSTTSGSSQPGYLFSSSLTYAAGDKLVFTAWIRSQTANGFVNGKPASIYLGGSANFVESGTPEMPLSNCAGDGSWHFCSVIGKVASPVSSPGATIAVFADSTHTIEIYEGTAFKIPAGVSEEQAYRYAMAAQTWPASAAAGQLSLHVGQSGTVAGLIAGPCGSNKQVQFDDGGVCGANAGFTFDKTSVTASVIRNANDANGALILENDSTSSSAEAKIQFNSSGATQQSAFGQHTASGNTLAYFYFGSNNFQLVGAGGNPVTQANGATQRFGVAQLAASTSTNACYNTTDQSGYNTLAACTSLAKYKLRIEPLVRFGASRAAFGNGGIISRFSASRSALGEVALLRPVSYTSKTSGRREAGFLAEEVEKIDPRFSTYDKDGGLIGVDYGRMVALLTKAIQEQQAQLAQQAKQIAALMAEVENLKRTATARPE